MRNENKNGIFSTTTIAAYADESETETEQNNKQKGVASGDGHVDNRANNSIDSLDVQICPDAKVAINLGGGMDLGIVDGEPVRYN